MEYSAKNFARSILAGPLTPTDMSLTVEAGKGNRFPVITNLINYTYLVLVNSTGTAFEIVQIASRGEGSDTMAIGQRACFGTTAQSWSAGDVIECRPMADMLAQAINDRAQHEAAADPHTQYLLDSQAGATGLGVLAAADAAAARTAMAAAKSGTNDDIRRFSKGVAGDVVALTSAAGSIAIDLSAGCNFSHTLTENTTLAAPSNPVSGQSGIITFTNHASSPKTLAYNAFWKFPSGSIKTLTASNGAIDAFCYYCPTADYAVCNLLKGIGL